MSKAPPSDSTTTGLNLELKLFILMLVFIRNRINCNLVIGPEVKVDSVFTGNKSRKAF